MSIAPDKRQGLALSLNAAEGTLEIGIADASGLLLFGCVIEAPSRGAEILTPALEAAFSLIGRKVSELDRIAVVRGPGSFTGIRLTAATAAGLARATGAAQAGIDYMDSLARESAPSLKTHAPDSLLWVLVRARRNLVYAKAYANDPDGTIPIRAVTELAVLPVLSGEAAAHILATASAHNASHVLLAGSGAAENRDALLAGLSMPAGLPGGPCGGPGATVLDIPMPSPHTLARMAREADYFSTDVEPLYVRSSDAETNLPRIAGRLGLDPDDAVRKLHELTHALPEEGEACHGAILHSV